jgi:hypothetical protein
MWCVGRTRRRTSGVRRICRRRRAMAPYESSPPDMNGNAHGTDGNKTANSHLFRNLRLVRSLHFAVSARSE